MIVFDVYEDDKNDILKKVQHDCYMNSVGSKLPLKSKHVFKSKSC